MVNGVHRHRPAGPGDRRDARHAEHLPRHRLPDRRQPPGPAGRPAAGLHRRRPRRRSSGIPLFVLIAVVVVVIGSVVLRWTRFGRQVYAVGSNPEAAAILGIPSRRVVFAAFAAVRPAGRRRRRHVGHPVRDDQRDVRDRRRARRSSRPSSSAASTSSAARDRRRRGARRALPRVHRQRPHPRRPVAVLAPGHLRRRDPRRGQRRRAHPAPAPARRPPSGAPDDAPPWPRDRRAVVDPPRSRAGRRCCSSRCSA